MSDRLAGRVVLVTGAASGMGAAQAELFAAHGASVVIADLDGSATSGLAEQIGPSAVGCVLDVREESDWTVALDLARETFGRPVDGLVNNAGIGGGASTVVDTDPDRYMKVVLTNQLGTLLAIRTCAPVMAAAGGGSIVLNSSVLGINGHRNLGTYVSTTFAIRGLAKVAALELAADRVRVNCICPGTHDPMPPRPTPGRPSAPPGSAADVTRRGDRPEHLLAICPQLPNRVDTVRAVGDRGGQTSEHISGRMGPWPLIDIGQRRRDLRRQPTQIGDPTQHAHPGVRHHPWRKCLRAGILDPRQAPYSLQDRHFR